MQTFYINNLNNLPDLEQNSCAIGNFDGLHVGHRDLIEKAKSNNIKTLVITFEKLNKSNIITSTKQKEKLISQMGVDYLVIFPFRVIKLVFFNEFINILKKLRVKYITCGADFRFGFKREGDIIDLRKKFKLTVVDDYIVNRTRVSTSIIKEFIADGLIEEANNLLKS